MPVFLLNRSRSRQERVHESRNGPRAEDSAARLPVSRSSRARSTPRMKRTLSASASALLRDSICRIRPYCGANRQADCPVNKVIEVHTDEDVRGYDVLRDK